MCANHFNTKIKNIKNIYLYLIAITLGIIGNYLNLGPLLILGRIVTDIFINMFKFVSLPIISLSIIVTLSGFREGSYIKKIWQKTLYYTLFTTILAALTACLLYWAIEPTNIVTSKGSTPSATLNIDSTSYFSYLGKIIPSNILTPFIEHHIMGVLVISILLGLAIPFIPEEQHKKAITHFFKGLHGIFIVITSWIVKLIPIALFGFISTTMSQLKAGVDISGLSKYLAVVILANLVQGFVTLPALLYFHKIKPFSAMKGMLPALSMAFFSKSSAGTLPVTINTIETNWQVSPKISRLVLPLCTTINMNGCAAFIFTTVVFVMQNYGMDFNFFNMMMWVLISTIAAIGNAGVPMGCFFLSASLLTGMNIPIELLGLILPFYSIIDMLETALNVWSDSCVTKIINKEMSIDKECSEKDLNLHDYC